MTQLGYRIGGIISGAGTLYLREILNWSEVFLILAFFILLIILLVFNLVDNGNYKKKRIVSESVLAPFVEFIQRNTLFKVLMIITFIFFFLNSVMW